MDGYMLLVVVHVMAAIIGIGPTYFSPVLLRTGQTTEQLHSSFRLGAILELFPKFGGSLAVLSGLALVIIGDYQFKDVWIYGSIAIYVIIQILVIGFVAPRQKKVLNWLLDQASAVRTSTNPPIEYNALLSQVRTIHYIATVLGIALFVLMIVKPTL
ncbi:DUF2269 family protein [Paenibacillus sp. PR3]|uniref:DUF2269 family protein n=1 Tax=Paenibacillus terricola TaxID=2763503 RepID=A0ABR8MY61_9BACL|nr:DUF2269 family protein [Paenibacillus terricola]MBD3920266.1 DUF2269 family protein [Paenibacillus terricola]